MAEVHAALRGIGLSHFHTFGHAADGNLHLNVAYPGDRPEYRGRIEDIVYRSIGALRGLRMKPPISSLTTHAWLRNRPGARRRRMQLTSAQAHPKRARPDREQGAMPSREVRGEAPLPLGLVNPPCWP